VYWINRILEKQSKNDFFMTHDSIKVKRKSELRAISEKNKIMVHCVLNVLMEMHSFDLWGNKIGSLIRKKDSSNYFQNIYLKMSLEFLQKSLWKSLKLVSASLWIENCDIGMPCFSFFKLSS
jgi:hypothetical protein